MLSGCQDKPWRNGHGHDCKMIARNPHAKGDWSDTKGVRADVACCKFGGGMKSEGRRCQDKPWRNGHGHDCKMIAKNPHAKGDWSDTKGVRADVACCKFGGGMKPPKSEMPRR